ncbi:hypothetical protein M422DRAFT_140968, partial [Sphaerobolus stellatus SS14]
DHSANTTTQHESCEPDCSKSKPKKIFITDENQRMQIHNIAHKFTYMNMLWLRHPDEVFRLDVDPDYNPANRFKSFDEEFQGILYELREEIPTKWHNEMDKEILIHTRANGSTRIRQAGPFIFGCQNVETFHNTNIRATTFREDIGFKMGKDRVGSYSKLAPILFKDYEGTFDRWKIFRNPILMKVQSHLYLITFFIKLPYKLQAYSALVRGLGSIQDIQEGELTNSSSHYTVESAWGVRKITPAAIAMVSIFTWFAASEDKKFQPIGSHIKINYQEDYEFYLKYLLEGLQSKSPSVLNIMDTWNQMLYPDKSN